MAFLPHSCELTKLQMRSLVKKRKKKLKNHKLEFTIFKKKNKHKKEKMFVSTGKCE